ncbi:MAG: O-antigen ligase family protein [Candidatus Kaiserbacteria bacterium]|nr:O-antigen ligase family protein [Candidatus Kaiserbacteria bacterium]
MKYIARAYSWLLLSPVILPVILWSGVIYPYLVPKTLLFYAVSLVSLAAFVLLVARGQVFFWGRLARRETWIPAALLLVAYGTSYWGIDFYRSFWSLFIRGDGLLMLTLAVADFYLILLYADRIFFSRLLRAGAVIGSLVAIYGIGEWFMGGGRIGSLLGNAAFFAGYLGITLFVTLAASADAPEGWRRLVHVGAWLQGIAIVLTATRGTILALALAFGVLVAYRAVTGEGKVRTVAASALAAVVLLGGFFFAFRAELATSSFPAVARIASISMNDADVANRLFAWRHMLFEIQKSPWTGSGAEHIDVLFNRFYDPTQISEDWFDRSHNAYLDYAAQYGVPGLFLYLALIALFFVGAARLARRGEKKYAGPLFLLPITYAVQHFFVFATISSFWLLLALLAALLAISSAEVPRTNPILPAWSRIVAWPVASLLLACIIPVSLQPALAAYDLAQGYTYQITDVSRQITYFSHGIALGTYGDVEYGYQVYDIYVHRQVPFLKGNDLLNAYTLSLNILSANFARYPYDARTALYLAHVLSLAPQGSTANADLLSAALERAIRLSPKRAQSWYILVNLSINDANKYAPNSPQRTAGYAAAQDILSRYIALVPTLSEPHFIFAELLRALGDMQGAKVEAEKGRVVYQPHVETARRAVGYYEGVSDWAQARFFLGEIVRLMPEDLVAQYDLAKVTYLAGDPTAAAAIVATLRAQDPALLETDQNFLAAITAYESR